MRIGFFSADWGLDENGRPTLPGGAGWARVHQPADRLMDGGHRTVVGSTVLARSDGLMHPGGWDGKPLMVDPELVVLQRWMHADAAMRQREARHAGQVVIHDVDDWFWGLDPANRAHKSTSRRASAEQNREHYRKAVEAADAVTVSTPFLAKRIRERFGVDTILLRNAVDARAFDPQLVRPVDTGLVIGWVGALQWRSGDLETLDPTLDAFLAESSSTFVHHGWFPGADTDTAASRAGVDPCRAGPTMDSVAPPDYPSLLVGMDVGLVPLADVPFNRAKSWIKGLEYAAAGIPFVAQATPEYVELADRGAGTVARTPEDWGTALRRYLDPEVRAADRERGLEVARSQDWTRRWRDWETCYEGLLARR